METATPFPAGTRVRMIDQGPAHHLRREPNQLLPVRKIGLPLAPEPKVSLVDQGGRLQSVVWTLGSQVLARNRPEFGIDQGNHRIQHR